jgi:predicted transcriptional regulator
MTTTSKRLDEVLQAVRRWPLDRQEDAADTLMAMYAQGTVVYRLSADERRKIEASLAQAERGEFAPDAAVNAMLDRHGL